MWKEGRFICFRADLVCVGICVSGMLLLFFTLSPEGMNGFGPNLYSYITGWEESTDDILVTLMSFSMSQKFKDLKNDLSA